MRPHLLRVQMHHVYKEQRGQAEGTTYCEISCFRLPDCMHAQALCAVADSFAATQHHQPPVEHWRYASLDLTCLYVLRSARCRYCSSSPHSSHLRYKDERVSETFRGWDAGVLEQRSLFLQESFPFLLTKRSEIDLAIVHEMRDDLVHSKGSKATAKALWQSHLQAYHQSHMKYLNQVLRNDFYKTADGREAPAKDALELGTFDDPSGYDGFTPSAHYLRTVWDESQQVRRVARLDKFVSGVEGEVRVPKGGGGASCITMNRVMLSFRAVESLINLMRFALTHGSPALPRSYANVRPVGMDLGGFLTQTAADG